MKNTIVAIAMTAFAAVCGFGSAFAAGPWYVDKNDQNAADSLVDGRGTEALPFRTIQAAIDNPSREAGDTVYVKPGVYDEGGAVDPTYGMSNRVYITTKSVILKAAGKKDEVHIVGRHDPLMEDSGEYGCGTNTVRCICVKDAAGTVIEGFTLRDGATVESSRNANNYSRGGGLFVYSSVKTVYLVDCVVSNCSARNGGGMYGGTAVRTLFSNCYGNTSGPGFDSGYAFSCVFTRCLGTYVHGYNGSAVSVNCTFVDNSGNGILGNSNKYKAYNALIAWNGGTEKQSSAILEDSTLTRTAAEGKYQVLSPVFGDYRPFSDATAVSLGQASNTNILSDAGVPADYLKYDFLGKEIVANGEGRINAGAVQSVATAASSRVEFDADATVDGVYFKQGAWLCSDVWPTQYLVRPIVPNGLTFYCYDRPKLTSSNWEPPLVYPETNGTLRITPPPASALASLAYTAKYAAAEIWVDPSSAGSDINGDGTESAPYQTLQKAVDSVDTDYTIIHAKRGDYASGGNMWSNLLCRVDFYTGKNDMHILLRADEGPSATAICGASDPTTLADAGEPGCGSAAARCVLLGRYAAVQGFTLKGGRTLNRDATTEGGTSDTGKNGAAVYQYQNTWHPLGQILDCVVTNCVGVNSVMFWGWANRCRFVGNSSRNTLFNRGVQAACLVHGNTSLGYLSNNTYTFMSTFANNMKHADASEWVNWYGASYVYDSVFLGGAVNRTAKEDLGNFVWEQTTTANLASTSSNADPLLADVAHDDFRPFFFSPVIGGGGTSGETYPFYAYVGSDFSGGPLAFGSDGSPSAGCLQSALPSAYALLSRNGTATTNVLERGEAASLVISQDSGASRWWKGAVELHEGELDVAWEAKGTPSSFAAAVAGDGVLEVKLDGEVLCEMSSSDGECSFSFNNRGSSRCLVFKFAGNGVAHLSGFSNHRGFVMTVW